MARKDHRVNEHGINVLNLAPGQWITVRWNDVGDVRCLLIDVEKRPATFKGFRDLKVLDKTYLGKGKYAWNICPNTVQHDQVVSIDGWLNPKPTK